MAPDRPAGRGPRRGLARTVACAACLLAGCRGEPFRGPLELLAVPMDTGRVARVQRLTLSGDTRAALFQSARYRVRLPRRPLLTFGLGLERVGAGAPGRYRLTVRAGGRTVFRHAFSDRDTRGFTGVRVPLEGQGQDALLEFELRRTDAPGETAQAPAALPAVAEPVLHDLDDYGRAKGVVLVSIDTLRRDHVGCYGYARPTTPRIDALARGGLLCEDAVSTSSWTLPAHLSMLTSVDAGEHGGVDGEHGFHRRVPTLASLLRAAGYATRAITSHLYVAPPYGLDEGFERFDFVEDRKAADVADRAIVQLDELGDRPFFLFLHFYDPHAHYTPPPETRALFPSAYSGPLKGLLTHFQTLTPRTTPRAYLDHLLSLYDAEIRYTDDQLGRVLDHLRGRGLDRSTLVVVTADHGEEFLDHGSWIHGRTLYEEIIRVPLVVYGPGVAPRREPAQASLLDVAPTVLEWAGLSLPDHFQGRSLLHSPGPRESFGDKGHGKGGARRVFLRGGQAGFKLILSLDRDQDRVIGEEWFDLATDPAEHRPSRPSVAEADAMRRRALSRWRDGRARGSAGPAVGLTREQIERLEALGYVGS